MPNRSDRREYRAVEFRQSGPGVIEGVVIPYGRASKIAGLFSETFQPASLSFGSVVVNRQHDRTRPLARLGHGLTLEDGPEALRARLELPDTADGRDTRSLVEMGVLRGFSAEFRCVREEWPTPRERVVYAAVLTGLAVVDDPAHAGAVIAEARARIEAMKAPGRRVWV